MGYIPKMLFNRKNRISYGSWGILFSDNPYYTCICLRGPKKINNIFTIDSPSGGFSIGKISKITLNKPRNSSWLVVYLPLQKILVSWDHYSQYMEKKTCSKPPTTYSKPIDGA